MSSTTHPKYLKSCSSSQSSQSSDNQVSKKPSSSRLSLTRLKTLPPRDYISKEVGMRQLSAAEERQIDEAIELANSFARLNANENVLLTPRSPSGSSKESLESPAHNAGHTFRFPAFRRRATVSAAHAPQDDRKAFVDCIGLTCDTAAIFTADAQAAYNELVAMSPPAAANETMMTKLPSGRQYRTHRLLSDSSASRPSLVRRLHRSSLSESDQGLILPASLDKIPRQLQPRDVFRRSTSLTEDQVTGAHQQHRIVLQSLSSSGATNSQVSHMTAHSVADSELPPDRAPSPPPALPPRIPLRPSTVNVRPKQRQYPLTKAVLCLSSKTRSMSETAQRNNQSHMLCDVLLPSRKTRSIDGDDVELEHRVSSTESVNAQLDSTRDSDDDVFSSGEELINMAGRKSQSTHVRLFTQLFNFNAKQLGYGDVLDLFWCKEIDLSNLANSRLLLTVDEMRKLSTASLSSQQKMPSDAVTYEDLMEFVLDGPCERNKTEDGAEDGKDDEILLLTKLMPNTVTRKECVEALSQTHWNLQNAVKFLSLSMLLCTGLANQHCCKNALLACNWNIHQAMVYLQTLNSTN